MKGSDFSCMYVVLRLALNKPVSCRLLALISVVVIISKVAEVVNINFVSGVLVGHELLQLVVRLCADIIYFSAVCHC